MPKKKTVEHPLNALAQYLPDNSYEHVAHYLNIHKVELTVTRSRNSILGDYRNAVSDKRHRISINGNLNKYSFLITLLHELAHLLTYNQYGHRVQSHGKEWKNFYAKLLQDFINIKAFPQDIVSALALSINNPAASCAADADLMKTLRKYDPIKANVYLLEDIPEGSSFMGSNGKIYKKGARLRKRFSCMEVDTGKMFLISPIYEVKLIRPL